MRLKVQNKAKGYTEKDIKKKQQDEKIVKILKKVFIQKRSLKDSF